MNVLERDGVPYSPCCDECVFYELLPTNDYLEGYGFCTEQEEVWDLPCSQFLQAVWCYMKRDDDAACPRFKPCT